MGARTAVMAPTLEIDIARAFWSRTRMQQQTRFDLNQILRSTGRPLSSANVLKKS